MRSVCPSWWTGNTTNDGNGIFLTRLPAKIPHLRCFTRDGFVDYDHDGDLDIFIAGPSLLLLRNNGDRTFTDYTAQAKLTEKITAHSVVPTDFDNRRDIDLLVASSEKVSLWRNMRDGTFRDVAAEVGLGEVKGSSSVAAGDVNKDGFTDFYFGGAGFALSRGNARFQFVRAPASETTAQFLDYDNDGLLDLVTSSTTQIRISRNTGNAFAQVATIPSGPSPFLHQVILITTATRIWLLGSRAADCESRAMTVATQTDRCVYLWPVKSVIALWWERRSRCAPGVWLRSLKPTRRFRRLRLPTLFSVSENEPLWMRCAGVVAGGIVQAETEFGSGAASKLRHRCVAHRADRKPSSCPYLYVWNGERFEFLTDFLVAGRWAISMRPAVTTHPTRTNTCASTAIY